MTEQIVDLLGTGALAYLVVFGVVAVDAFFPVVPGETVVIVGGILAASGELSVAAVGAAAAAGALVGDHVSYCLGRFAGRPATARLFRGGRAQARLEWAGQQLRRRGVLVIAVSRYIPGGRTSVTFSAGLTCFPWPRFLFADVVAALSWASFATGLGYFGGRAIEDSFWKPLALALAAAILLGGAIEGVRRLRERRTEAD
ncbi:MAG TPA: DedA family protein [Gaiellaceae bacterium]|nr:DedA family protein [Gaiellaceae bacterium]